MNRTKVLFIDDKQSAFDILKRVFDEGKYFELVNEDAIFDEGSTTIYSREQQKEIIKKELIEEDYKVILFDLSLRRSTDKDISPAMADKEFLSIEIYNEMRSWLKEHNKKFVFVTSHKEWFDESKFRSIGRSVEDAYFMRKAEDDKELYFACRYIKEDGKPICGGVFTRCSKNKCFNELLWRIVKE